MRIQGDLYNDLNMQIGKSLLRPRAQPDKPTKHCLLLNQLGLFAWRGKVTASARFERR